VQVVECPLLVLSAFDGSLSPFYRVDFWGWHGVDAGSGFDRPESTLQHWAFSILAAAAAALEKSLWM
jgi:hypothetical protein